MPANTGKNTDNLKGPWKPGQSGNPSGRPKVAQEFRARCREFMEADGWEKLAVLATDRRSKDHMKALELICGYAYGKPKQGLELTGDEGGDINITIKRV